MRFFNFGRFALLAFFSLLLASCGGRTISKKTARDVILDSPAAVFDKKEDVDILSVSQMGGKNAVVEATVRTAFRLEKVGGKWKIREIRVGNRQWEDLDDVLRALEQTKAERTRSILDRIAAAVEQYRTKNGSLPAFRNYVELSDALYPRYMSPLIRRDAWYGSLAAYRLDSRTIQLVAPGPDGVLGTGDDIELTRSYPL